MDTRGNHQIRLQKYCVPTTFKSHVSSRTLRNLSSRGRQQKSGTRNHFSTQSRIFGNLHSFIVCLNLQPVVVIVLPVTGIIDGGE